MQLHQLRRLYVTRSLVYNQAACSLMCNRSWGRSECLTNLIFPFKKLAKSSADAVELAGILCRHFQLFCVDASLSRSKISLDRKAKFFLSLCNISRNEEAVKVLLGLEDSLDRTPVVQRKISQGLEGVKGCWKQSYKGNIEFCQAEEKYS